MADNWKMDYGVSKQCKQDVKKVCASAMSKHGGGEVLKCLAQNHDSLSSSDCQTEVARATKMALWQYRKGAAMTEECDEDAQTLCAGDFPDGSSVATKKLGQCQMYLQQCLCSPVASDLYLRRAILQFSIPMYCSSGSTFGFFKQTVCCMQMSVHLFPALQANV